MYSLTQTRPLTPSIPYNLQYTLFVCLSAIICAATNQNRMAPYAVCAPIPGLFCLIPASFCLCLQPFFFFFPPAIFIDPYQREEKKKEKSLFSVFNAWFMASGLSISCTGICKSRLRHSSTMLFNHHADNKIAMRCDLILGNYFMSIAPFGACP